MNGQRASTQSYYRIEGDGCNIRDESRPLLVNCSGVAAMDVPFRTNNVKGRHDYYLMVLTHGSLDAAAGSTSFRLQPGDVVIYRPNQPYAYQRVGEERMVYLWAHFTGFDVERILQERGLALDTVYHMERCEETEADFEAIHRLFITRPLYYLEEAGEWLALLLTHIGRRILQSDDAYLRERLKKSLRYLNHHYNEPIALEKLAAMEYLSPSRYSALFRQMAGVSPQQYLIGLRLQNARELLTHTDMSVSEIARSVGYEDALYFSRLCRKHFGFSPKAFRRQTAVR